MAELHLWMQAWSDQGERILVRVQVVDKVERTTLAVDCTEADFRTFETALNQILPNMAKHGEGLLLKLSLNKELPAVQSR